MSRYTPSNILVSHLAPPPVPGGVAPKFGSEKVPRYTEVSQLQLRVSRYTVQLSSEQAHLSPQKIARNLAFYNAPNVHAIERSFL